MEILALIPARGGSKGIPRKNIKALHGKPLIGYAIEAALFANCFSEVMVSTEDEEIAAVARAFGATVPFLRPAELATDSASSITVVQHVLDAYSKQNRFFDAVCLLQPTAPLRTASLISNAVKHFITTNCDSLITVRSVPHEYHPDWVLVPTENGAKIATGISEFPTQRQALRPAYHRDGAIYIAKTATLLSGTFYGNHLELLPTDTLPHVNLDTLLDWEVAEKMLKSR
jgi:CMP-N-acetylneuraminic acid synthetase